MITRLLLVLLFFFIAAPSSVAQTTLETRIDTPFEAPLPLLRPAVVVMSDLVTLGDLFDHAGVYAETPVFRAPAPGTRGRVMAHAVLEAANGAGLERIDLAGLNEITVERAGVLLTGDDLTTLVQEMLDRRLTSQMGDGAGHYAVTLADQPSAIMVGAEIADRLYVDLTLAPSQRSQGFTAIVRSPRGVELARIEGHAEHRIAVPVLNRAISRGDVVRASDLRLQDIAYTRTIGTPILIDPDDIIGQATRRSLRAGAPINPDDLMAPLMIERQELVTLVYRHGGLALTVRARAMDNGAEGQAIDVMNLQSSRIVRGVVTGHGLVSVLGPMQEIAASANISGSAPLTSSPVAERIQ